MAIAPTHQTPKSSQAVLERSTLQMASSLHLQVVLTTITQGLVDELDPGVCRL